MMTKRMNEKTKKFQATKSTKENRINVRVDDKLLRMVDEFANEYGLSRSNVTRLALQGELNHVGTKLNITTEQFDTLMRRLERLDDVMSKYERTFSSIGNNVNQIAKRVNTINYLTDDDKKLLTTLSKDVRTLCGMLKDTSDKLWSEV